ncbi:MAG: autotransporter outer membrane beta-barrel domain-containing protein, partial [Pseudomonadota bacterium]
VLGVTAAPVPTFSAGFAPNTVAQGGTSTLTVTLDNSGGLLDATGAAFDVPLPTDMVVATPSNAATDCGPGILTATVGAATADLAGGTIPAGGTCSVSFDVTSVSADAAQTVTTGALTTSLGDVTTGAAATLNVTAAPLPIFTKLFAPATITQGEVTTVTYTIDNSAALVPADAIVFSESFAGGVVLADPPNGTDTCGGTSTGTAGAGSFAYVGGGTVAAGDTCEVAFNVTSVEVGSPTLTSDDLVTSLGNSGTAAASLTVQAAPVPLVSVSFDDVTIVQGGVSTLRIGIENVAAISATAINFTNTMPDGMIPDLATRNPTNGCNGTLNVSGGSEVFTLVGGSLDPFASCEITVPIQATQGGIQTNTLVVSSSLGDSTPAPASIDVTAAPAPTATALFVPDTIVQGDVSTFTVSIDNAGALVSADTLDVTVPLPAGLVVAPTANAASTCAAPTFAATPGDSSFALTGGEVAAGGTCDFAVDVRGTVDDAYTVTTGALTSSLGDGGTATASLTVTPADTPLFSVALSPATITQGLTSTAIYTIDNSAPLIDATTAGFVGQVQSGLEIAAVPNASTTCTAGAVQITGPGTFDFADGTILAGETCTVSVDVTGTTVGTFDVAGGPLITSQGTSGNTVASLTVNDAPAPGFGSRYAPPSIPQGGTTRLILTVDNSAGAGRSPRPAAGIPASNLGFNVNLPAGLNLTDTPGLTNSCGGSATAPANGTSVTLTGGSVAALSTCTVEANVTSMTQGAVPAISGALSSSLGGAALAPPSEPLVVTENLQGTVTFVQNTDTDGNFGFSSSEAALNFTIATVGGSGIFGPVSVDAGTYTVTQSRPAGLGNTSLTCSDDDSTVDVAAGTVTLNIAELEDVTCTFGSIGSQQETTDQINSFLNRRNNLILSNGPSSGRRMDRLNQGIGRSQTLSFQQGDLASMTPFSFDLLSLGSGSYKFSTSSTQIQRSSRMFRLAMDDVEGNSQVWTPPRWDVWFEASFTKYEASQGSDGHFGIAYLGADYLLSADLLVGALVQVDSLDDGNDGTGATTEGTGWMFGPYMTARIGDNLIFDGRLAYGQSDNTISPFGTYADDFDSDRILIDASLSGNYDWNNWVVTPNLAISYIEDRQRSYVDSLGVTIPEQTVSLGQIRVGPTFSTTLDGQNGSVIRPSFTLNGIYNFSDTDGVVIVNDTSGETDGFRARIEAGVEIAGRNGARFQFSANYDGIGQSDFESYGARFQLSIPLQ